MVVSSILSNLPAETNFRCLDIVIKNGIPLTFIMLAERVTCLYCCIINEMVYDSVLTGDDWRRIVLPLRLPRYGPQMNSAFLTSCAVIRQLGMRLWVI